MSIRSNIVQNIKDRLKTLSQNDSFWQRVTFLEWERDLDDSSLPALVIFDKKDNPTQKNQTTKHNLDIDILLYTSGDEAKPEFIRERTKEIVKVFDDEFDFEKENTQYTEEYFELKGVDIDVENGEQKQATSMVEIVVGYSSGLWEI